MGKISRFIPTGVPCLVIVIGIFGYIGSIMGVPNMLNTLMNTAYQLLLNTVFYLMGICVVTGAIGRLFVEFGVVKLVEKLLRPLMKPLFNLPGVASLGAVMTFLSDNPAIISLAQDKRFSSYFKKVQYISLTNFGTAFGMGLIVIVFMIGQGFTYEPIIGLFGAFCGCIVSTRLMQRFVTKAHPQYAIDPAVSPEELEADAEKEKEEEEATGEEKSLFIRILNSLLDGGRTGVDVGLAIIPGVLIITTLVILLTNGANPETGLYDGAANQGVGLLPWLAGKLDFLFRWIFGFNDPHLVAVPITALGARLGRWKCHRCLHRHRYVLEWLPQYPHRHVGCHRLSRVDSESHPGAHHRWTLCRCHCPLGLYAGESYCLKYELN
jgi:hypothetical protein